jgi:hypothetical protein
MTSDLAEGDRADLSQRSELQAAHEHPWRRPDNFDGNGRGDRYG